MGQKSQAIAARKARRDEHRRRFTEAQQEQEQQREPKVRRPCFIVLQEGGSSGEVYVHAHDTVRAAQTDRHECAKASYRTSPVIEVPESLANAGEDLYDLIERCAKAEFDYA